MNQTQKNFETEPVHESRLPPGAGIVVAFIGGIFVWIIIGMIAFGCWTVWKIAGWVR